MSVQRLIKRETLSQNQVAIGSKRLGVTIPETVTASNAVLQNLSAVVIRENDFGAAVRLTRSSNVYTLFIPLSEVQGEIEVRATVDSTGSSVRAQNCTLALGTSGQDRTVTVTTFNGGTATPLPINVELIAFI